MNGSEGPAVESQGMADFARVMRPGPLVAGSASSKTGRVNLTADEAKNGLGRLVLTLVKLLHTLLEKQAVRRIEAGSLTELEIERLGVTFMKQAQEIDRLRIAFGLAEEDLNIDLGPLGRILEE